MLITTRETSETLRICKTHIIAADSSIKKRWYLDLTIYCSFKESNCSPFFERLVEFAVIVVMICLKIFLET